MDGFELKISCENHADCLRLGVIYPQSIGAGLWQVIAKRRAAAHPHALLLGGSDLVADPLSGDLPLKLGKREQYIEGQPAHAGGGVEGLCDTHETDVILLEQFHHAGKIRERAGQPINLVDHHDVDAARGDIGEQLLKPGTLHAATGIAPVIIAGGQGPPAYACLTLDIGLTGLILGIEAVEALIKPFFGAFAGIDGTAF